MNTISTTHLVLIPSYNPGVKVYETVRAARQYWSPVWIVVDGSTDGSTDGLLAMAAQDASLHVIVLARNQGKGAAVLHGLEQAVAAGFSTAGQALQFQRHAELHSAREAELLSALDAARNAFDDDMAALALRADDTVSMAKARQAEFDGLLAAN